MNLFDPKTETEFEVLFAPPTAARRARLARIHEQLTEDIRVVTQRHPKCYEIERMQPEGYADPLPPYEAPPEHILSGEDRLAWVQAEQTWRAAEQRRRDAILVAMQQRYMSDPANFDANVQAYEADAEVVKDLHMIRMFQCGLITRTLPDAYRELVESDASSEFWQQQDFGVIKEGAARFRDSCSTGQRADSVHPDVGGVSSATATVEGVEGKPGSSAS